MFTRCVTHDYKTLIVYRKGILKFMKKKQRLLPVVHQAKKISNKFKHNEARTVPKQPKCFLFQDLASHVWLITRA